MQARTATCLAGGRGRGPWKDSAYRALLAISSSVTDMVVPPGGCRWWTAPAAAPVGATARPPDRVRRRHRCGGRARSPPGRDDGARSRPRPLTGRRPGAEVTPPGVALPVGERLSRELLQQLDVRQQ